MKSFLIVLSAFVFSLGFTGCETTKNNNADGISFPEPNAARTSENVQRTHSQFLRGGLY